MTDSSGAPDIPIIIMDTGSGDTKCGMGGETGARQTVPSIVGTPRYMHMLTGVDSKQYYVGQKALARGGLLSIKNPIERGIIVDWENMERLWNHVMRKELHINPEGCCVIQTEPPLNPKPVRETMVECMFESFRVQATYIGIAAVLALYAAGRSSGLVVDSGDGVTQVVPVYEGYAITHAITRVNLGGRDLTEHLNSVLRMESRGAVAAKSTALQVTKKIKEKMCYVALDFEAELDRAYKSEEIKRRYILPDGQIITLNNVRFRCPEALFKPALLGIRDAGGLHDMVRSVINRCDVQLKKLLYKNVVLAGGNTLFPGTEDRIKKELKAAVRKNVPVKTFAPPDRQFSAWIGASILSQVSTFNNMWIKKSEYEEYGPQIVHKKCF